MRPYTYEHFEKLQRHKTKYSVPNFVLSFLMQDRQLVVCLNTVRGVRDCSAAMCFINAL